MKCHFCEEDKPDVSVRTDPFAQIVNGEDWQVPMCDPCEQVRFDDS